MERLSSLIRADGEYKKFLSSLEGAFSSSQNLPIAVNGLTGGAEVAFLVESVLEARKISRAPVLVLVESEGEREKVAEALISAGVDALQYKKRDLVFHNIRASHDVDRERLSVLYRVMRGECDAVVSTPSAAAIYTVPEEILMKLTLSIETGDTVSPFELAERLVMLGFASVETVDGKGQFSRRGGILDFWGGESEHPIRVEFFGDEVDRMVYFDPITQRSVAICEQIKLLPATEVMLGTEARERVLSAVKCLISKAKDEAAREKLAREKSVLESTLTVDFRDKYLGLIYPERANLFSYYSTNSKCAVFILGTNGCGEDLKRHADYYKDERKNLIEAGVAWPEGAS